MSGGRGAVAGQAAILGAGRRGADWAARFLLMGWDVAIFDPDPQAEARLAETLTRARAALPALYDVALPAEGRSRVAGGISAAVTGAACIIDAAPDRAELKRTLFRAAQTAAEPGTPLISTARVLSLDELRVCSVRPDDIALARAEEPAWLLPHVDLRAGPALQRARDVLNSVGLAMPEGDDGVAGANRAARDAGSGRDDAAVAVLRALKAKRAGAGVALATHEAAIAPAEPADLSAPLDTMRRQVPPDWVDYNGHMNEARYLTAFSDATDRLLLWAGMDAACIAEGHSVFSVETHIRHLGEVDIGDMITVTTRVLDGTGKRLHLWHDMICNGDLVATGEQLLLHVDLESRRVALPRADVGAWFEAVEKAQAGLPAPVGLGRHVGAPREA